MHLVIHPNDNTRPLYPTLGANIHDKNHSKTFREKEKEREREKFIGIDIMSISIEDIFFMRANLSSLLSLLLSSLFISNQREYIS